MVDSVGVGVKVAGCRSNLVTAENGVQLHFLTTNVKYYMLFMILNDG